MGSKRKRGNKEAVAVSQPLTKRPRQTEKAGKPSAEVLQEKVPFPLDPSNEDRKREATLYEFLGSEDPEERLAAADAIVFGLLDGEGVPQTDLWRHIDRRLFRGLASGRKGSRIGFSLVLTELLSQLYGAKGLAKTKYPDLTFEKLFKRLLENTTPKGNIPGQQEKDHYLGQLFGIESFISSGICASDNTKWQTILDVVFKLAQTKTWIRSQCGWLVIQSVPRMTQSTAELTLQKLAEEKLVKTSEGVGILLAVTKRFPNVNLPPKTWRDPFAAKNLGDLASIVKESGRQSDEEAVSEPLKPRQANWTAQLHFIWDVLLQHFQEIAETDEKSAAEQLKLFWSRVVDDSFFARNATEAQKFSGFMIFTKILDGLVSYRHCVEKLFSKNFMNCLMNQATKEDRYLHRAAVKALKAIEAAAAKEPKVIPTILRQLLGHHGSYNFDHRTKAKTVETVLHSTDPHHMDSVVKVLSTIFSPTVEDDEKNGRRSRIYSDYLVTLGSLDGKVDGSSTASPAEGSAVAIRELAHLAFPSAQPKPGSKAESAVKAIRERLLTLFAKKARQSQEYGILIDLVLAIEDSALAHLPHDLREESTEAMQRIKQARSQDVPVESTTQNTPQTGIVLLDAAALLQLYNGEEDAVVTLRDLKACHAIMKETDTSVESSTSQAEVLVEVILAMLARPSPLMRQVTLQAFESLTKTMTPEAIRLLTDVLTVAENEKGQRAIFKLGQEDDDESLADDDDDVDDDMEDEEHEVDTDDDIHEDIVLNGIELVNGEDASGDEDENQNAEEDGSDAEEAPKDLQDLDNELEKILRSHRLDKDADAASSSGESDMTDSEMMALDETLANAFKSRVKHHGRKKQKADAMETVINFKHRVLDLLAVFLRKEAGTNILAFQVLVPLLELIRTTTAKPLAQKATEAITDFGKSLKRLRSRGEDNAEPVDATALLTLLEEIHQEASRDPSHAFARAVSSASLAVAAHLLYIDESNLEEIFEIYGKTLKEWALGRIRLQASFSLDWHNWLAGHAATAHSAAKPDTDM